MSVRLGNRESGEIKRNAGMESYSDYPLPPNHYPPVLPPYTLLASFLWPLSRNASSNKQPAPIEIAVSAILKAGK